MVAKVVVSVISIILVVGVVIGVVAVVHHQTSNNKSSSNQQDENLSTSMKYVDALCAPAVYKEKCVQTLGPVAQNKSATPEDYITAAVKQAIDELTKAFNLTDTLVPKVNGTENPNMTKMAVDDCQDLLDYAIQKINAVFNQVGDPKVYADQMKTWDLRLWLSDVLTYQDNCMDSLQDAKAPELHKIMENGMVNSTELTMSVLDVITYFNDALGQLGLDVNTSKLIEGLKSGGDVGGSAGSGRRLLGIRSAIDGTPAWMSVADRRLLDLRAGIQPVPHATVSLDGSGQFRTIQQAVDSYDPKTHNQPRFIIYVKAGVYNEVVLIGNKSPNIFMYGDGLDKTIVKGSRSFASGYPTSKTAPFNVQGDGFLCKNMGFENTAGPDGHQAVALRINAERAVFQSCGFYGFQDTLYAQGGSHFFTDCTITGTVDFIFGNGATIIQKSRLVVRLPSQNQFNAVTAQGRLGPNQVTGIVVQNCDISPEPALFPQRLVVKTYLGRPWKPYARAVIMESNIGDLIQPQGWSEWEGTKFLDTLLFAEYANRGPGAALEQRVKWPTHKILNKQEALAWTVGTFLPGSDLWLKEDGVPYTLGLMA